MNITMLHDLDTGFLASTLKPAFEQLGHNVTVLQTLTTYLEEPASHIDILLKDLEDTSSLIPIFKDTDLFILRTVTDTTLRLTGALPYINQHNTIWRVHGSELRDRNVPYSLRTWQLNWHNKEPIIVGPRDPSLIPLYRGNVITTIERPCAFDIFPKKRIKDIYALHTPTRPEKKGTDELLQLFTKEGTIPLHIISGMPRADILKWKAGASYFIDYLGSYNQGPYGMNSVEAWYYKIPVFSQYKPSDVVMCPQLPQLIHSFDTKDLQSSILSYTKDNKQLTKARNYALETHDPLLIAQQYINLAQHIKELEQ